MAKVERRMLIKTVDDSIYTYMHDSVSVTELEEAFAKIPPEHKENAYVLLSGEDGIDGAIYLNLEYRYPEPEEEYQKRVAEEAARVEKAKRENEKAAAQQEANEKALYEKLKAKYG